MARISSYPVDQNPTGSDILLGTDSAGGTNATKNFRLSDVSAVVINDWLQTTNWKFNIDEIGEAVRKAQLWFPATGGDNTPWANITVLRASTMMKNNTDAQPYLEYLLTNDPVTGQPVANNLIKIYDRYDLSSFGIFKFTSLALVPDETFIYDLGLTFIEGTGAIQDKHFYGIDIDPAGSVDKNFVFVQAVPSTQWTIQHNLSKFPSVTVIDSANTVVTGEYTYIDNNNVILNFSAEFAGKAYLN